MKKNKIIGSLVLLALVVNNLVSTSAMSNTESFRSNTAHYQELCARRSSFEANLTTCRAFEEYLQNQRNNANNQSTRLQSNIDATRNDINRIIEVIKQNEELIALTTRQIEQTHADILLIEEDIASLEYDIRRSLVLKQEITIDNLVIDFLMSANSLQEFMLKMDGFNAINQASMTLASDFNAQLNNLEQTRANLASQEEALERANNERQELLTEQKTREAELFVQLEESRRASLAYENKASELNYDDIILATQPEPEPEPEPIVVDTTEEESDEVETSPTPNPPAPTPPPANNGGNANRIRIPVDNFVVTARTWHYPISFGGGWHPGIDLANRSGTPILSPGRGVVLVAAWDWGYGNYLVTAHQVGNNTYTVIIGHLNSFVRTSGVIERGELIGRMGSTGWSTGPHAHIEIFRHSNRTLQQVVNQFNSNRDIYFGLGYHNIQRGHIQRLKPGNFWGI